MHVFGVGTRVGPRWGLGVLVALAVPAGMAASCSNGAPSQPPVATGGGGTDSGFVFDTGAPDTGTAKDTGAPPSDAACGDANTMTDPANCGMCKHACGAGALCTMGVCTCPADAGLAMCGGACVAPQTDPANCGTCGHVCQASTCSAGLCKPNPIVTNAGAVWDLAVSSNFVYWTVHGSMGSVMKAPITGGGSPQIVASMLSDPRGIVVDTKNVYAYWVEYGPAAVKQVQIQGGPVITDFSLAADAGADAGSGPEPMDITVDESGTIFWTDYGDAKVMSVVSGGGQTPTVLYAGVPGQAPGQNRPYAIAVDANNVYWVDQTAGAVYQLPKTATVATSPITLSSGDSNPYDIVVDSTNVYWVDNVNGGSAGAVKTVPIAGADGGVGTVTVLAMGEGGPYGIALDDKNVYWTDSNDGTVKAVPKTGGSPVLLAEGQLSPQAIAVDGTNVYWANSGAGTIALVTKP